MVMSMDNFGKELNSMEKIALNTTGIEGEGQHFVMNGEAANVTLRREKEMKFNDAVDEYVNKFDKHNKAMEDYAKTISENINGLEIMPMGEYVLIRPYKQNPFQQIKVTKSGIITDLGGYAPTYKSNETGEVEEELAYIKVGTVIETGCDCKFLKAGDTVFYSINSEIMIPFFKQDFVVVAEKRILSIVNEKLTERRDNLRNK